MCLGARRSYTLLNTPASRHPIFAHVFAFGAAHWSLPSLCCHHSARRSTLSVFATCTVALHGCMHTACCLCQSRSSLYARPLYCCLGCLPVPRNGSTAQHGSTAQERKAHTKAHTNEASLPTAQRPAHQNMYRTHHTRYFGGALTAPHAVRRVD